MSLRIQQHALSKGEISPRLYGRNDLAAWTTAVKRARNVVILKEGGLTMRPGMEFVGPVFDQSKAPRLLPFQFGLDQSYALEFGQAYMRPAALGGFVLEQELAIIAITQANPAVVTIQNHPYQAGDEIFFTGVVGMLEINNSVFRVLARLDDDRFSIDANSTGWGAFAGSTGGVTLDDPPAPPPVVPPPPDPVPPPEPPYVPPGGGGAGGGDGGGWEFVRPV